MGYVEIGKIVNTQGVRGEVRVIPTTDEPGIFERLDAVDVNLNGKRLSYGIEGARPHKQFILVKFKGIDTKNLADTLRGGLITIDRSLATQPGQDEYFIGDLYGVKVVTEDGEELGELHEVIFTGANDVYVVRAEGKQDLLLPAIKQCILNVDVIGKIMTVHLMDGLRD